MSIEERNTNWDGAAREFWQLDTRGSSPRLWQIWIENNTLWYRWGQVGGELQTASETCMGVNQGKRNEVSPSEHAKQQALRYIKKKIREGYAEYVKGAPLDPPSQSTIDFDNLPPNLCFYKPDNSLGAGLLKKAEQGQVWYARKRNGLMYVLSRGSGLVKMYSRRMLRFHDDEASTGYTWDDRFSHIISHLDLPRDTILLGELVMDREGADDFAHVQSLTKSLTPQSLRDQQGKGRPSFYCWDVAFWEGHPMVAVAPVRQRYDLIQNFMATVGNPFILPVEVRNFTSPDEAVKFAKAAGWEGFVVVDPLGIYGDKGYNFKGKPDRPGAFCGKLKPAFENDFVVLWDPSKGHGEVSSKGRYAGGIKSVALYQYNTEGKLVFVSNCASGMTEEMKRYWARPELYPAVWEIQYTSRRFMSQGDDTNALDFPRFVRVRPDKQPTECVSGEL